MAVRAVCELQFGDGGFSPFIVTWLIGRTGNAAIPGAWLTFVAAISLAAALFTAKPSEPIYRMMT